MRAILAATMGAVATVLALIFSVALLVLSMVSALFGPRHSQVLVYWEPLGKGNEACPKTYRQPNGVRT
jgi:hypothetical protein